jgi:[ribosomal protein S5]-alanine N-acetyltransferase
MKPFLTLKLRSERLVIRPPTERDLKVLRAAMKVSAEHLREWQPTPSADPASLTVLSQGIERDRALWRRDLQYAFLVLSEDESEVVGRVSLSGVWRGAYQGAFLGYWTSAAYLRKGYAKEFIQRVLKCAFTDLALHRVQAAIMPNNVASLAVIRALAFREEGLAKSYLRINDEWRDHLLFAKLSSEAFP